MDYNKGKLLLEQKVEDFYNNEKMYLAKTFQETENRTRFINPFFQALGWEFEQTGIARQFWDVHQEFSQKDNSSTKKPDYAFRADKKVKFFVEAKAPWVPLTDKAPVFQAKRYAFSTNGKAPIVILTDFQEFRVFNSLKRPLLDNPLDGLIKELDLTYKQYPDNWDLLWNTFSKEAVLNGSLESFIAKAPKNTKTLDVEFLEDLTSWREILAKNIAIRNEKLNVDQINEAVQRVLDRFVFIRNLEDREIEEENLLYNILNTKEDNENSFYSKLIPIFHRMNSDYNGLLFKDHFSEQLLIDNKVIIDLIKNMCYPVSPFQFDVIEPEILGRIYEKFLGSKIRLTDSHRAKVEEKPEVRHAGGVYYTPEYIVNYIVSNTVGKLIEGKNPEQISKVKIVDPACGSGSFLLGAYDYLLQYHKEWYLKNEDVKKYKDDYYKNQNKEIFLTNRKKSEILKNNIFGVDIDREATEVAIMSLYLKALEEGTDSSQLKMFKKDSILPDMTSNIRCGNSLLSRDELFEYNLFGDDDINPFDWSDESKGFGHVLKNNHGFDCIIGNPPYIRIQEMQKWAPKEADLYKKIYRSGGAGNFDIYVLFIEKALTLLNENGLCGYILPNKYMQQDYGKTIRDILIQGKHLEQIINFKDFQVFNGATTYTSISIFSKKSKPSFKYSECDNEKMECNFSKISIDYLNQDAWVLHKSEDLEIINKMNQNPQLGELCDNIFVGIQTSADNVFILDLIEEKQTTYKLFSKSLDKEVELEKAFLRHIISGVDVKKYVIPANRQYVIFPYFIENDKAVLIPKKVLENESPLIWEYLSSHKSTLENRERGKFKDSQWYRFGRNQNINKQHLSKICVPRLVKEIQAIYDINGDYCQDNVDVGGIILKDEYKHLDYYILGLLNSSLLSFYLSKISTPFRGGFWSCNRQYLEKLPIYLPDEKEEEKFKICKQIEEMAKQIIDFKNNTNKTSDAEFLEKKVDEFVMFIYLNKRKI